jgi:hypothetical protein
MEAPKRGFSPYDMRVVIRRDSTTLLQCAVMHRSDLRHMFSHHSGPSEGARQAAEMVDEAVTPGCVRVFYVSRLNQWGIAIVDVPRPGPRAAHTLN